MFVSQYLHWKTGVILFKIKGTVKQFNKNRNKCNSDAVGMHDYSGSISGKTLYLTLDCEIFH